MSAAATALADLAERYWQFQREEYPTLAIQAGVPIDTDRLMRASVADDERRAAWAAATLEELARIGGDGLSASERTSRALLERELQGLVSHVATRSGLRPSLYPLGPEFQLLGWANATSLATLDDAERYLARLSSIPDALNDVQEAIAQGISLGLRYPALVVGRAVEVVRGQTDLPLESNPFYRPFAALAGRGGAYAEIVSAGLDRVRDSVVPAIVRYADFLDTEVRAAARDDLACTADLGGLDHYEHLIEEYSTTRMPPAEIHQLGLAEVARITAEMVEVAGAAGYTDDLAGFRRHLTTDNRQILESAEALREQIEILSKRIDARIPEYFGRIPRSSYGVTSIPEAISAAMPPAYAQPNPADGSAAGVHWITSTPVKLPRYLHIPIALHEAWPGHLMHLALIQEMEDLPAFRRNGALRYSACLEGWALYCERLGEDMGFYDTPEKRYGRLEMEMWRAVRLVVDTGLHAKGWSRELAIDYSREHLTLPLETIEAEVDRYVGLPAQALGYQIGNIRFRNLRERAERTLGTRFNIRDFHDALMAAGPVTLDLLDTIIGDWIDQRAEIAA